MKEKTTRKQTCDVCENEFDMCIIRNEPEKMRGIIEDEEIEDMKKHSEKFDSIFPDYCYYDGYELYIFCSKECEDYFSFKKNHNY